MTTHEFWRDTATGQVWAVELEDGVVSGCCGPLDWSEVDEDFLGSFDYLPDYASWVEANREQFALLETRFAG
jgi:hypothetical protein